MAKTKDPPSPVLPVAKPVKKPKVKNNKDPRHIKRIYRMQQLFSWEFGSQKKFTPKIKQIIPDIPKLDLIIKKHAPKWPIDKINKVDLAVLRNAVWELTVDKKTPKKVVIDEAVEIAKQFGTDTSSSFVNGVLGSIIKKNKKNASKK